MNGTRSYRIVLIAIVVTIMLLGTLNVNTLEMEAEAGKVVDQTQSDALDSSLLQSIDAFIEQALESSDIPGLSLTLVKGNAVYQQGYGNADVDKGEAVTKQTLFELASNSKAFTGLAILKLENEGLLKLDDDITQYVPWLKMKVNGQTARVTIEQVIQHKSGIPFKSIANIPPSDSENALLQTVQTLVGTELAYRPGLQFEYATINYDILGLIVQTVAGVPYEDYMQEQILSPLGMNNTYLFHEEAKRNLAQGYKRAFFKSRVYEAPIYRGNKPAGYIISNGTDMASWLQYQLGLKKHDELSAIIEQSHQSSGAYRFGWGFFRVDGAQLISHDGNNPNYSSSILLSPDAGMGIAVLANLNSAYTGSIANGIAALMKGEEPKLIQSDQYTEMDSLASIIVIVCILIVVVLLYFASRTIRQIYRKKRSRLQVGAKALFVIACSVLFMGVFLYTLSYIVTNTLFQGLPIHFIQVWAPASIMVAMYSLALVILLIYGNVLLIWLYPKPKEIPYGFLLVLSITSGLGNASIIFLINEALFGGGKERIGLYFALSILIYIVSQKIIMTKLIKISNQIIFDKRIDLIHNLLESSYENIEEIDGGKILAGLNNDTERINRFVGLILAVVTNVLTVLFCFIYLGYLSWIGLILSVVAILITAGFYMYIGKKSNQLWERSRDIQNIFFKYITDLVYGFKELTLHRKRRKQFKDEMVENCDSYRHYRVKAEVNFTNVSIIGELLFVGVIGMVVFVFPIVVSTLELDTVRRFAFVFLYMTGPIVSTLNAIPELMQIRIAWQRIQELNKQLETSKEACAGIGEEVGEVEKIKVQQIELRDVTYQYIMDEGLCFAVGPIDCRFSAGEVTFITGGNGSGKTTLIKLLSGLYIPDGGEIWVNNEKVEAGAIRDMVSVVFSDVYLFDKLYGIDFENKEQEINELLALLQLSEKVSVKDGVLSTVKLSTGQRKRLALMLSYLEDRPICILDEWAADQDPEFRHYFYDVILPDLKRRGKCVIAITHDDRYFDKADQILKMEMGSIVK
ncbi:cyclic peptide transporter [Paenibacillus sp. DS2015]|uniref:cyclic peptide export ABC transporter n=1 Tax=Paenibacillus sp. DS2015 TaxID=3373917 RepID=UPI003D237DA5